MPVDDVPHDNPMLAVICNKDGKNTNLTLCYSDQCSKVLTYSAEELEELYRKVERYITPKSNRRSNRTRDYCARISNVGYTTLCIDKAYDIINMTFAYDSDYVLFKKRVLKFMELVKYYFGF
jgi:hypothetical protein